MSNNNNTRVCKVCHQEFPETFDYFSRRPNCKNGLLPTCKTCMTIKRGATQRKFPAPEGMKCCTKCKQIFPATTECFFVHNGKKASKSGLAPTCKACSRARDNDNAKQWYYDNKDRVLIERRQDYKRDPEKKIASVRDYAKRNPQKIYAIQRNRRARKKMAEGSHTADDIKRLYEDQDGRCLYCGITLFDRYHVDHMIPLVQGGSNAPENLAIACSLCNLSKHGKTISQWEQARGW